MSKKKTPRDKIKNVGLRKEKFSKIKQEYHDIDYVNKLNDEEKQWLSKFLEEDLGARFNHGQENIYTEKDDVRASYRRNNQRNRDLYAIERAKGNLILGGGLELAELIETKQQEGLEWLDYEDYFISNLNEEDCE